MALLDIDGNRLDRELTGVTRWAAKRAARWSTGGATGNHRNRLIALYSLVVDEYQRSFCEDNDATRDDFLRGCFDAANEAAHRETEQVMATIRAKALGKAPTDG